MLKTVKNELCSLTQESQKNEGEIFIQKSLRTRGRLEDIKILGEMSFIHYSRKKNKGGGSLEVNITRYYCRKTLLLVIKNQEEFPWKIRDII